MAKNPHFPILDRIQINQHQFWLFEVPTSQPLGEKNFPETPMCFNSGTHSQNS